jgi:hypothetical protein
MMWSSQGLKQKEGFIYPLILLVPFGLLELFILFNNIEQQIIREHDILFILCAFLKKILHMNDYSSWILDVMLIMRWFKIRTSKSVSDNNKLDLERNQSEK